MAQLDYQEHAYRVLPLLVHYAQLGETPYYKDIGDAIGVNPHTILPSVLGYIRDQICTPRDLPWINSIVVSKATKLPGEGFLPGGIGGLTEEEIAQKFRQFRDDAFSCEKWDELLDELGLHPLGRTDSELDKEADEYNKVMERKGSGVGGEQAKHLALKDFIAHFPQEIGIEALCIPKQEHQFLSADRCDILIRLAGGASAVVEIKVGHPGELVKGIYQLVKYRALLEAEKTHGDGHYPVDLHLVAYSIPSDIQVFAMKFGIQSHVIDESKVKGK